ncbi:hypothetical protein [Cytobacillus oceanisediminis]|uniref:REase associating with pPIWI RE domain-containing protein n=1 Tax=Cytobacillus oceanisediminis 2691 TaxID=1196031 RepID=A0A160MEA3_9BACI|nr:hypothetical protein [Cytobacillus oceanisediminis]AND41436.1 hypothetical protein A361_20475 [Cytobacillus oceanisediminis 2691]
MPVVQKIVEIIEWAKRVEADIEICNQNLVGATQASKGFEEFRKKLLFDMLQKPQAIYPATVYEFLLLLKQPIGSWGYFSIDELNKENIDEFFTILDDEIGITPEAEELLNEEQSFHESSTKKIREALVSCRKFYEIYQNESMQEQYTAFRTFLIHNPITDEETIEAFCFKHRLEPFLISILEDCYENIPSGFVYKCQACGWTLEEKTKGYFTCVKRECRKKLDVFSLKNSKIESHQNKRVLKSILLSTVIPGKKELQLVEDLKKLSVTVQLYPQLEKKGDIYAFQEYENILEYAFIDVKDYTRPKRLAEELLKEKEEGTLKTEIIAVPDDKASKRYIEYVNRTLQERGHMDVRIYSFSMIKEMFKRNGSSRLKGRVKHKSVNRKENDNVQILF